MVDALSNSGRTHAPASGLNIGASSASPSQSMRPSAEGISASNSAGPATIVDLSDRAKALLAQSRVAQDVAENLAKQIAAMKGKDSDQIKNQYKTDFPAKTSQDIDIFKVISELDLGKKTEQTKWKAGAPYGDPTTSDAEFLKNNLFDQEGFAPQGWSPEEVRTFKDAIRNGTVKIQNAADIEGLNFTSWQVFTPNANNGAGHDSMGGTSQNPTGDVKKAIDSHRAMAMWTADRGDVYLSW
ncbi:hypothetical protein [Methylobacterium indicum]|uniref:hypothetical protein n=1 Tax=Methylobacterium indicum TaxID=1775910 RepID=UPI0009E9E294|nr:hypothetical protein [Methylobacterium indicum]